MKNLNNFHYAFFLANQLYNLDMQPDDAEEVGLIAWNLIGNKRVRTYKAQLDINKDNTVTLPCNCDIIEAVTYNFEDWNYVSNTLPNGDYTSQFTEHYIEGQKILNDPLYIPGKYVKYERVGDTLYLDQHYNGKIFILYKGQILDDDGLPQITDKEARAIATYCAWSVKFKEGLMTNNTAIIQVADRLLQMWNQQCDAARVSDRLTQNDVDEILDARTSWNRKIYRKSYKVIQ